MKQGTELVYPTTAPVNSVRLLVCGGRDYHDRDRLFGILSALNPALIIHGAARGADALADEWARSHAVGIKSFPADWTLHGKSAGPRRNVLMLHEGHPTLVVAFPGGRGTGRHGTQDQRRIGAARMKHSGFSRQERSIPATLERSREIDGSRSIYRIPL